MGFSSVVRMESKGCACGWGWLPRRVYCQWSPRTVKQSRIGTSDIHFYNHRAPPYGFLSNFYSAQILIDGKTWPTTEHYFQAMKFAGVDKAFVERIRMAGSPGEAARLGRAKKLRARRDWNEDCVSTHGRASKVKVEVMRKALQAKFDQHVGLREQLLATKGRKLVERTAKDSYWGDGGAAGSGKNMLGTLLMELRDNVLLQDQGGKHGRRHK